jgi:hypothetical protein
MISSPGYYPWMFSRTKRFLSLHHRVKIKGIGVRRPSSPQTEPNFTTVLLPHSQELRINPLKTEMIILDPVSQQHLGGVWLVFQQKTQPWLWYIISSFQHWRQYQGVRQNRQQRSVTEAAWVGITDKAELLPENWSLSCTSYVRWIAFSVVHVSSPSDHFG